MSYTDASCNVCPSVLRSAEPTPAKVTQQKTLTIALDARTFAASMLTLVS